MTPKANDTRDGMAAPTADLLRELVSHLRQNRAKLRQEWAQRITESRLLTAMSKEEIFAEATSVYDNYVEVLETGSVEALQAYARNLSERIIPRGVETHEVVGIVLLLRDVLARSLFQKYQADFGLLNQVLDAYEPAANRIANTVAVGFVQERERIIRQQAEAIRELSTPVLQVRERLLILQLHELLSFLRRQGVNSFFTESQHGLLATAMGTPIDVSYLADSVLMLRYFEAFGHVRQAISVVKNRTGTHERTLREFLMDGKIRIGKPLEE